MLNIYCLLSGGTQKLTVENETEIDYTEKHYKNTQA